MQVFGTAGNEIRIFAAATDAVAEYLESLPYESVTAPTLGPALSSADRSLRQYTINRAALDALKQRELI
ncbi:MAG TPA: hypothetical protein VFB25_10830 [Gaiellaceae bacterium]|nr:hypothetical protein [Gaiellaceae bacterium]